MSRQNRQRFRLARQFRRDGLLAVLFAATTLAGICPSNALAQEQPAAATTQIDADAIASASGQATQLMRESKFAEAAVPAMHAVALAETLHGVDSLDAAIARHNLGFILRRADRPAEAQRHLERALATYERLLPAVHQDLMNVTAELGQVYVDSGRGSDLALIYARHIARAEQEGHGQHLNVALMLANQGFVLRGLKQADDSEAAFLRALAITESDGQIASDSYLTILEAVLDRFQQTKRLDLAEAKANAAIAALAALGAKGLPFVVVLNNRQSVLALDAGRSDAAKRYAQATLALFEAQAIAPLPGRLDQKVAALNNLARAYRGLADFKRAEEAYRQSIALLEANGDKRNAGIVTDNLAVLFMHQGRLEEAERLTKRGLALLEEALGHDHPTVGQTAGNLGALLNDAGRPDEAEPFLRRALRIAEAQPTRNPVGIAIIEDNLAGLLRMTGRRDEARRHYERAISLFVSALPETHPRIATARNNFGRFLLDSGKLPEAEAELRTALALFERIFGADSFNMAIPAANLAEVLTGMKRYTEARQLFRRALAALESVHGKTHASLQVTLSSAAALELADGKPSAARTLYERAVAIELEKQARAGIRAFAGSAFEARRAFHGLMDALWQEGAAARTRNAARALEIAQWDSATPAAVALAALGARAGASDPALGALTRERQDLAADWVGLDKRLTQILSDPGPRNETAEGQSRARLAEIDARLAEIDAELARRFPRYQELSRPLPLAIDEIRKLIGPREAAVQFTVTNDVTHVFAITDAEVRWYRSPIRSQQLSALVRNLRCGLDRAEWAGDGGTRCSTLLGLDRAQAPGPNDPLPFDLMGAHNLYTFLLQPLADTLAGRDLLVVASGSLTSLPLHVLLTEPPLLDGRPATSKDAVTIGPGTRLDAIGWLGRRHAITVLPSLPSLAPLRRLVKPSAGALPYIGVGNPLLTGPDGTDRSAFEVPACRIVPARQQVAAVSPHPQQTSIVRSMTHTAGWPATRAARRGGLETLRRQWPLPETADEVCRVAGFAGASHKEVIVGADATETRIKAMSAEGKLAEARIVHFATHGLLAGETAQFLADKVEPSLMLTPPAAASDVDDGLLTASEVAGLKLDADWVVLSACNTASGDEIGAEALSGLARAFFYAGARSLLVSHWAVDSNATVRLVTAAFDALAGTPGTTQGRALSRAMAALIDGGGRDAHPENWAPFVVVGDGAGALNAAVVPVSLPPTGAAAPVPPASRPATAPTQKQAVPVSPASSDTTAKRPRTSKPKTDPVEPDWTMQVFQ